MLAEFAPEIWTVERDFKVGFMNLGARMTVIRLQSGGLLLHSPVQWTEELGQAVSILGPIRYIVAPNLFHHLFIPDWMDRFPEAQTLAAPGLPQKRTNLRFDGLLSNDDAPEWGPELSHECLAGSPKLNEVILFHHPSRTLVVTDLLFYLNQATGSAAFYGWINGCRKQPRPTHVLKFLVKEREAFARSMARILDWNPERLILSHGSCLSEGAGPLIAEGLVPWT